MSRVAKETFVSVVSFTHAVGMSEIEIVDMDCWDGEPGGRDHSLSAALVSLSAQLCIFHGASCVSSSSSKDDKGASGLNGKKCCPWTAGVLLFEAASLSYTVENTRQLWSSRLFKSKNGGDTGISLN